MISRRHLARNLAAAILAEDWTAEGSEAALRRALDAPEGANARDLARAVHEVFPEPVSPPPDSLAGRMQALREFGNALAAVRRRRTPFPEVLDSPRWAPQPPFRDLDLPEIGTLADLADWLGVLPAELERYADADGRLARPGQAAFRHYACHWLPKRSGGRRLIEAPKPRLKRQQRRILHGILDLVPPHPAAFGFVRGRNCLQGAARHAGEEVVVSLDLRDFFVSVPASRVHALFRTLGYPWAVARLLTGLCTVTTPVEVRAELPPDQRYRALPGRALAAPHLPQGAPTSPALANSAARRMDTRLAALARKMEAAYSRYADDITFSGPRRIVFEGATPLMEIAGEIAAEEGFTLNPAKTRVQGRGARQTVTGLVVNRHLNIRRDAYDRLKAVLHNCRLKGPASQNRDRRPDFRAHLDGRVAWVEAVNLHRGRRLRIMFDQIDWAR